MQGVAAAEQLEMCKGKEDVFSSIERNYKIMLAAIAVIATAIAVI